MIYQSPFTVEAPQNAEVSQRGDEREKDMFSISYSTPFPSAGPPRGLQAGTNGFLHSPSGAEAGGSNHAKPTSPIANAKIGKVFHGDVA
jgi:hypothetical protein